MIYKGVVSLVLECISKIEMENYTIHLERVLPGDASQTWVRHKYKVELPTDREWKSEEEFLGAVKHFIPDINPKRQYVYSEENCYSDMTMRIPNYVSLSHFLTERRQLYKGCRYSLGNYLRELPMESANIHDRMTSLENTVSTLSNEVKLSNVLMRQLLKVIADKEAK